MSHANSSGETDLDAQLKELGLYEEDMSMREKRQLLDTIELSRISAKSDRDRLPGSEIHDTETSGPVATQPEKSAFRQLVSADTGDGDNTSPLIGSQPALRRRPLHDSAEGDAEALSAAGQRGSGPPSSPRTDGEPVAMESESPTPVDVDPQPVRADLTGSGDEDVIDDVTPDPPVSYKSRCGYTVALHQQSARLRRLLASVQDDCQPLDTRFQLICSALQRAETERRQRLMRLSRYEPWSEDPVRPVTNFRPPASPPPSPPAPAATATRSPSSSPESVQDENQLPDPAKPETESAGAAAEGAADQLTTIDPRPHSRAHRLLAQSIASQKSARPGKLQLTLRQRSPSPPADQWLSAAGPRRSRGAIRRRPAPAQPDQEEVVVIKPGPLLLGKNLSKTKPRQPDSEPRKRRRLRVPSSSSDEEEDCVAGEPRPGSALSPRASNPSGLPGRTPAAAESHTPAGHSGGGLAGGDSPPSHGSGSQRPRPLADDSNSLAAERDRPPDQLTQCPLCAAFFPQNVVEEHASRCEGQEEEVQVLAESPPAPARTRAVASARARRVQGAGSRSDQVDREQCSLCGQRFLPGQEYLDHVDHCVQRVRSVETDGAADEGTSGCSIEDDEAVGVSGVASPGPGRPDPAASCRPTLNFSSAGLSNFTPISAQRDSCIDYHNQFSATTLPAPTRRRLPGRAKRGRARRRRARGGKRK